MAKTFSTAVHRSGATLGSGLTGWQYVRSPGRGTSSTRVTNCDRGGAGPPRSFTMTPTQQARFVPQARPDSTQPARRPPSQRGRPSSPARGSAHRYKGGANTSAIERCERLFEHAHHPLVAVDRPRGQRAVGIHRRAPVRPAYICHQAHRTTRRKRSLGLLTCTATNPNGHPMPQRCGDRDQDLRSLTCLVRNRFSPEEG